MKEDKYFFVTGKAANYDLTEEEFSSLMKILPSSKKIDSHSILVDDLTQVADAYEKMQIDT